MLDVEKLGALCCVQVLHRSTLAATRHSFDILSQGILSQGLLSQGLLLQGRRTQGNLSHACTC